MAQLKLTPAQADFFAERLVWKGQDVLESNRDLDQAGMVDAYERLAPLVDLGRELSEREVKDPEEALRALAREAMDETREAIGYAEVSLARVRGGDARMFLDPEEKGAQEASEATYEK